MEQNLETSEDEISSAQRARDAQQKHDWLTRYLRQPLDVPEEIRRAAEGLGLGTIRAFAWADFNAGRPRTWVLLTERAFVAVAEGGGLPRAVELERLEKVELRSSRVQNLLRLRLKGGEAPLDFRFSHRQKKSFENLKEIFDRALSAAELPEATESYVNSITDKVLKTNVAEGTHKFGVLLRLLAYLKPYRREVLIGIGASLMLTTMALIPSRVTGLLIDRVLKPHESGALDTESAARFFWWLTLGLAGSYVMREVFAWARYQWMSMLGEYVATDLRRDIYSHLQGLGLDFFGSKSTGSLVSRITSDTDRLWDFIAFGVVEVFVSSLMILGIGAVLLSMDPQLGLIMLLPIPLLLFAIYWHGERMQKLFLRIWRKWSKMSGLASDTLSGIRVVKAFNRGQQETNRFMKANSEVLSEAERIHVAWTRFWPSLMLGIHMLLLGVWVVAGPRLLSRGPDQMTVGTFVSFIIYAGLFIQPIEVIGQISRMMNRAVTSAHRVFEVLDIKPGIVETANPVRMPELKGRIEFERVKFSYDGVRTVLSGIDLQIEAGEMIGLVGPTGSGKSTLIQLLMRFYDPSGGKILLDGVDLSRLSLDDFRSQVGMVLQESYLFHGSILDNIRYGRPDASLAEVVIAAQAARVHDFVSKLPYGYDTRVGERGHTLSGGERQRVAIARALIQNPRILILDEATSAVDSETERKIQEALDRLIQGRTVIAIAHRLSTLQKADRLVVIKDGAIVERGTHAELLAIEGGLFRKLSQMQHAGFVSFDESSEEPSRSIATT